MVTVSVHHNTTAADAHARMTAAHMSTPFAMSPRTTAAVAPGTLGPGKPPPPEALALAVLGKRSTETSEGRAPPGPSTGIIDDLVLLLDKAMVVVAVVTAAASL